MTRRIGILLFDGVEELDAVGPWEVLAFWARNFPQDDTAVVTITTGSDPVVCAKGMRIVPDLSPADTLALHLVGRLAGVSRAREVRRGIQYDPRPPV